jgi:DNA-binding transcriptional MerR regulator
MSEIHTTVTVYTIETVEKVTQLPKEQILLYYREGLITPQATTDDENLTFDEQAVHRLRRFRFLIAQYEINHVGLKHFAALLDEVERLREELRFLRNR